jgi:hypothetical protein
MQVIELLHRQWGAKLSFELSDSGTLLHLKQLHQVKDK